MGSSRRAAQWCGIWNQRARSGTVMLAFENMSQMCNLKSVVTRGFGLLNLRDWLQEKVECHLRSGRI